MFSVRSLRKTLSVIESSTFLSALNFDKILKASANIISPRAYIMLYVSEVCTGILIYDDSMAATISEETRLRARPSLTIRSL